MSGPLVWTKADERVPSENRWWGYGTEPFTYNTSDLNNYGGLYARMERFNSGTVSQNIKDDMTEGARQTARKDSWTDLKTDMDTLRDKEDAPAYQWPSASNADIHPTRVGSFEYRRNLGAAWERWEVDIGVDTFWWHKTSGLQSESWGEVVSLCVNDPDGEGGNNPTVGIEGVRSGIQHECSLGRTTFKVNMTGSDLSGSVQGYSMMLTAGKSEEYGGQAWSDWHRDFSLELWSATGSEWDDRLALIKSWDRSTLITEEENQGYFQHPSVGGAFLYADITAHIPNPLPLSGTDLYFLCCLNHDDTTGSGGGTLTAPVAPPDGTTYYEGADMGITKIFGYVDTISQI